jgi:cell wall-associated NlpC family hydrolase
MNGVSLDTLLALQKTDTIGSVLSDSTSGSSFATLLAEQLTGEEDETSAIASLADTESDADVKKEMILNLCMMMCQSGNTNSMMLSLLSALSGDSSVDALSATQESSIYSLLGLTNTSDSAEKALGEKIVDTALTRLGDPYSTTYRGTGDYVDCSSLVQWTYKQAGISLPGTSVKQAQYCAENGYTISKEELQPGDLIFWSNTASTDGRWHDIHHVGIYAGDGKVVEAKSSTGGVVIDDIWGENGKTWKIDMYARPYAASSASAST